MATKDDALYVRNGHPNRVVINYQGTRFPLEHRGNRKDSIALPKAAENDHDIARWLKNGTLERISRDAFMKLGARKVDVLPNEYLKRNVRDPRRADVVMHPAEADATRSPTQVNDGDVHKSVRENLKPEWAGDLMSTEEELEVFDPHGDMADDYPSKHRDDGVRRAMGY